MATIHCIHCGTQLPDTANFCLVCGKSPRGNSTASSIATPKVEYTEIVVDISTPLLEYGDPDAAFLREKAEEKQRQAEIIARQRVMVAIQPYLLQGWMLDGPFDAAVVIGWQHKYFPHRKRLHDASVKLRR